MTPTIGKAECSTLNIKEMDKALVSLKQGHHKRVDSDSYRVVLVNRASTSPHLTATLEIDDQGNRRVNCDYLSAEKGCFCERDQGGENEQE